MKKVLVMSFGSDAGGIEKSLIEFLKFLVTKDINIDLYLWRKPGILFHQIPERVTVITDTLYPGSFRLVSRENILKMLMHVVWYFIFRVCRVLGKQFVAFKPIPKQYDIAISYCQNGYSPYYIIDKVKATKKYLWYHHGSYEKSEKEKKVDEWYYNKYDKIITVSNSNFNMLAKCFPSIRKNIIVIPNLLDEEEIKRLSNENIE